MKSMIYWFSGTGNSFWTAGKLAAGLGDAELCPIASATGDECAGATSVGFIFPVYYFGLPNIVRRFLDRVAIDSGSYVFSIATMGGKKAGCTHHQVKEILGEQGIELAAGWSIQMPANYTPLFSPPKEAEQQRLFTAADARVVEIAKAVCDGTSGVYEDSGALLRCCATPVYSFVSKRASRKDGAFTIQDQCSYCGTCAQVCPVKNIDLEEGKPVWQHHCEQCLACLQWCPVEAIQLGSMTVGRKRYHHPEVKLEDLLLFDNPGSDDTPESGE